MFCTQCRTQRPNCPDSPGTSQSLVLLAASDHTLVPEVEEDWSAPQIA